MRYQKKVVAIGLLIAIVVLFRNCTVNDTIGNDPRGTDYAGIASCTSCHKDIMSSVTHSGHYKTSSEVRHDSLQKKNNQANAILYYADSSLVKLEERHGQYFQSYIDNGKTVRSEQMAIAFGSGEKAQTYAYWKGHELFQLPLTYYAGNNSWTNSPGYSFKKPFFNRVILSRCLECHASFVQKTIIESGPMQVSEQMKPTSIIFGIDCERCHGPAAAHVKFQKEHLGDKTARFITPVKFLSRQQKMDLCGSCHSGNDRDVVVSLFSFKPGDTLSNFFLPQFGLEGSDKQDDVHGKQMQLLQSSKCFQKSQMTCVTCHDVHRSESGQLSVAISKCMGCHNQSEHGKQMITNTKNCIDCHMPLLPSKKLIFNNGAETKNITYMLRSHRIAVY